MKLRHVIYLLLVGPWHGFIAVLVAMLIGFLAEDAGLRGSAIIGLIVTLLVYVGVSVWVATFIDLKIIRKWLITDIQWRRSYTWKLVGTNFSLLVANIMIPMSYIDRQDDLQILITFLVQVLVSHGVLLGGYLWILHKAPTITDPVEVFD